MSQWLVKPLWVLACCLLTAPALGGDGVDRSTGVLRLRTNDFVDGWLADYDGADQLAWQNGAFDSPFLFPLGSIATAAFAAPEHIDKPGGHFGLEMVNGDQVFGSPVGIDEQSLRLRTTAFGDLTIRRDMLRRLFRWHDGEAMLYLGPGGLDAWQIDGGDDAWQELGGQLRTDRPLTSIYDDIGIPAQARIEIELSWEGQPNFAVAFGVDESEASARTAFRLEVWDTSFVLVRELDETAEVVSVGSVAEANEKLKLTMDLDQENSRAVVYSERGEKLADLQIGEGRNDPLPGIRLENILGSVQLDSLRLIHGGGELARDVREDQSRLHMEDGQVIYGRWTGVDQDAWIFTDDQTEHRVDPMKVVAASFEPDSAPEDDPEAEDEAERESERDAESEADDQPRMHVVTHGGIRLTGLLEKAADGVLRLRGDAMEETVAIAVADVRALSVIGAGQPSEPSPPGRVGRLELANTRLHGRLVDAEANDQTSCLRFHPRMATHSATMLPGASGRLVYRDPAPKPVAQPTERQRQQQRQPKGLFGAFVDAFANGESAPSGPGQRAIHLRTGDIVPGEIQRIDEEAVFIDSTVTGATRIPHDQIKAVELMSGRTAPSIDEAKRHRLLTVPRMRKKNPPTHLIISSDGDFLRGRLQQLDEESLTVETRLESIEIPRQVVSQIIWFHPDELDDSESAGAEDDAVTDSPPADAPPAELRVQAVQRNGVRLTFEPSQLGGGELIGESPLLGVCLIDLSSVDQLLIGRQIGVDVADLPYHRWRLSHAPEPKVLQEGEDGDGPGRRIPGTTSALVGTDAPDFDLELLDGGSFRIREQKGKIVVLDFWATWCGPCIQAMPQVDEAVAEFAEDDVILVAVNLQESADQIHAALERLKLSPAVALDIDGVAAARYQANAIPQTVVIDRSGKIARLFVGGGPTLGEQLREAIEETLAADAKP